MFWKKKGVPLQDEARIDDLLSRSVAEVIPSADSLKKLLRSGKTLRVKLGFDPTGERIHVGHSVPLLKLRDFQELGHTVVFIVGDFTAVIGDTSDKESERPMLSRADIEKNMASWRAQVGKILDLDKAEFRYNSEWLGSLTYRDIGEHADVFSVSDFIARENIKRRLDTGKRVSLREVLYPLMQGYDSVAVKADVEIGGTDQRFNLLAGRALQERFKLAPQHVVTFPLITDATGKKLSKTGGATIYITDEPTDMFGKAMTVPDELVEQYCTSMTRIPRARISELIQGHPKEAKMALAYELVRMYHSEGAATKARESFENTFSKGGVPTDMPEVRLSGRQLVDALVEAKIVESKSDYRRLDEAGAIKKISEDGNGTVYRIGKHRFVKVI